MSKLLDASCENGEVTCQGVVVEAEILSEGQGPSQGALILEGDKAKYITSNATDIKETLEKLSEVLETIATTLTSIGAGMTGPTTAPPGDLGTNVAEILAVKADLDTLKGALK